MKPAHKHIDCSTCTFLGQLTAPVLGDLSKSVTWDFYLCEPTDPPARGLIARYGTGDREMITSAAPLARLAADTTAWPMNVAAQLVLARRTKTP